MVKEHKMLSVEDIEDVLNTEVVAAINDEDYVIESMNCGLVLSEMSQAGLAFTDVARSILGEEIQPEVKRTFIQRIFGRFR